MSGVESECEVRLDLTRCCIETAARQAHRAAVTAALELEEADPALEARLALLQELLEQQDFRALRACWPELCGGRPVEVIVYRSGAGVAWRVRRPP